jgi:hypothetical protein
VLADRDERRMLVVQPYSRGLARCRVAVRQRARYAEGAAVAASVASRAAASVAVAAAWLWPPRRRRET